MEKKCNACGNEGMSKITMSSADWERNEQRHERREKRLVWLIALLITLLVGTNIGWLVYESQFEAVEETTEEYTIEQDAGTGNNNSVINGGEVINGEANN